ncbi:MAG: SRPBCC family protein [Actinomycetota bacterium]|nr:SRPBCC family protein [Actinomycetota bacterium]
MEFSTSTVVTATPARVWEVYSAVEGWPGWTASVVSVELVDPGPLRVGQRVRVRQPKLPAAVWTVTELEEGRTWTWVATGPGVRTTARHTVEPEGRGARVVIEFAQRGVIGTLLGRLTAGLTDRYLAMEAEGLKARAEEQ